MSLNNMVESMQVDSLIVEEILEINSLTQEKPRKSLEKAKKILANPQLNQTQVAWVNVILARAQFQISNRKSKYVTKKFINSVEKMKTEIEKPMPENDLLFFESTFLLMTLSLWGAENPRTKWGGLVFNDHEKAAEKHRKRVVKLAEQQKVNIPIIKFFE